ncbi:MAG TPA: response regulator [Verrucomicrobiae bacterium]
MKPRNAKDNAPARAPLVYVVDDEAMIVTLIDAILAPAGYGLKLFRDPELLLKALGAAKPKPDVLITDFAMGAVNGMELIERSKALHPKLKTIMISGTVDQNFVRLAPVKPDRFLAKPFESRTLLGAVEALLNA